MTKIFKPNWQTFTDITTKWQVEISWNLENK